MARLSIRFRLMIAILSLASVTFGAPKGSATKGAHPQAIVTQRKSAPPLSETAQKHFKAGVAYVDDPTGPKWDEAYREFLAAYADTPTWVLMNNIGLCALNLERDGEAIAAYKIYLEGGGEPNLSPKGRKQIETDIETLTASLVKIDITTEPAEATILDERKNNKSVAVLNNYPVKEGKTTLGLHPGRHKLVVEAPGYVSEEWIVDAPPGSSHAHTFKLVPVKKEETVPLVEAEPVSAKPKIVPPRSRITTPFIVSAVATGVFAAGATVTGLITHSKQSDYENAPNSAEADRIRKSGKTLGLITDIEIGAAIVAATATAVFYFTAPTSTKTEIVSSSRLQLVPGVSPGAASLNVTGNF